MLGVAAQVVRGLDVFLYYFVRLLGHYAQASLEGVVVDVHLLETPRQEII